jgi:hypothetical protein
MRKKIAMLGLALAALAGAYLSTPEARAAAGTCQPRCTYYSDGSKCCVPCWGTWPNCGCTNVYCPPEGGIN